MRGVELLRALKKGAAYPPCVGIPVGKPIQAFLRPVITNSASESADDVIHLSEWRNQFVESFLTEFDAHPARTAKWLREQIANDDSRILFMVDDSESNTVGYIGLAYINWDKAYVEADSVVRGRPTEKGLMTKVMQTLLDWSVNQLGLKTVGVRVRSDNPALSFYRKFGFAEVKRTPLLRTESDGMITWKLIDQNEAIEGNPELVHMELS